MSWKDIQNIQWQSDLSENSENHDINKRSDTSAKSSDCTWEHLILKDHAEVTLSDKTCRSIWKWSSRQDDWRCTWVISITDRASAHWDDDETDAHTETDQINMKNSLKREIQHSSFLISDIKDDTSASATAQELCKVSQHIIDAVTHQENWLQSIFTWEMSTQCHYDDVWVWQRSNVNQAHFINMFQMKSRMKSNATRRKYHELEKAFRNHEHSNDDHSNDTLNEHTESISSCDVIEESDERKKE